MKKETISADVVVVGYGLAGAVAAVTAHDAGVKVVIVEKAVHFGGNSILSGGGVLCVDDPEKAVQYFDALCGGRTGPDVIQAQATMMSKTEDYLRHLCKINGATLSKRGRHGIYPFPGKDGINSVTVDEVPSFEGYRWLLALSGGVVEVPGSEGHRWLSALSGGARLMKVMEDNVNARRIEVVMSTTTKDLLTDAGGAVTGVVGERDGKKIVFNSRRAVVLACGGFEHNEKLKLQFLEGSPYYSMAPLTHTGDGIIMSMKLGASLWHMWHVHGSYGFKYPDFPIAFRSRIDGARDPYPHRPHYIKMRWIVVDQSGKRFMNEYPPAPQDTPHRPLSYFDPDLPGHPRIPSYLIFDEPARREGPMSRPMGLRDTAYQWSKDNSKEIERGWIIKADTLADLASKINVPSDNLKVTVERWNKGVETGKDLDFGRPAGTMFSPIETPPYYAMEAWPIIVNTQGGPEHNAKQQVMHVSGTPIPRLYAVGEIGSMFGHIYELGGNLGECVSSGRIAGENAAEEKPSC